MTFAGRRRIQSQDQLICYPNTPHGGSSKQEKENTIAFCISCFSNDLSYKPQGQACSRYRRQWTCRWSNIILSIRLTNCDLFGQCNSVQLFILVTELVAEIRMSDGDQRRRSVFICFAVQIGNAIFGNYIMDIISGRCDRRSWL